MNNPLDTRGGHIFYLRELPANCHDRDLGVLTNSLVMPCTAPSKEEEKLPSLYILMPCNLCSFFRSRIACAADEFLDLFLKKGERFFNLAYWPTSQKTNVVAKRS